MKKMHYISTILFIWILALAGTGWAFPTLDMSQKQVVVASATNPTQIYQYMYINGAYVNTWTSDPIPADGINGISVGDANNDGTPDITAVVKFAGRGRKYIKIYMYNSGSEGLPNYIGPDLSKTFSYINDSIIADVDNDGDNELVIVGDDTVGIFRWDGSEFINIWDRSYPNLIFSVDVGDVDTDGVNEIVLSPFSLGSPVILESLGNDAWEEEDMIESLPDTSVYIDYAKVRDADNLPGNEIVAGGNNNRLMIWKYDPEGAYKYDLVFVSTDLGGFTQGVDAGDIDGDEQNEVITLDISSDNIYRFDYIIGTYQLAEPIYQIPISYLALGSIDADSQDEIFVYSFQLSILKHDGSGLSLEHEFPFTGKFEIWEDEIHVVPDTDPPAEVSDLWAFNPTSSSIDVSWTAPGDDGIEGTASYYDIRYSTSLITESNWIDAIPCTGEPTPALAGSGEEFTVAGLAPLTTYFFAMKTADEASNQSALSNIASTTTSDSITQSMHISAIDMSLKMTGIRVNAIATVSIVDEFGNPVVGATVYGQWSDATSDADSGVTDTKGQVEFTSDKLKTTPGTTFTATVVNITKDGWDYDPGSNIVTSGSIIYN
jgi:hypothetical protein